MEKLEGIIERYPALATKLEDYLKHNFKSNGHKMRGYTFFTQTEPRHDQNEEYILLQQMVSDKGKMWGDVGVVISLFALLT